MKSAIKSVAIPMMFFLVQAVVAKEADTAPKKNSPLNIKELFQRKFLDQNQVDVGHAGNDSRTLTIYHFFASWCSSCREELIHIPEILPSIPDSVKMIFVSIDPEMKDALSAFKQKTLSKIHVTHDPNGDLLKKLGKKSIPATFIFNHKNQLIADVSGPVMNPPGDFLTYLNKISPGSVPAASSTP